MQADRSVCCRQAGVCVGCGAPMFALQGVYPRAHLQHLWISKSHLCVCVCFAGRSRLEHLRSQRALSVWRGVWSLGRGYAQWKSVETSSNCVFCMHNVALCCGNGAFKVCPWAIDGKDTPPCILVWGAEGLKDASESRVAVYGCAPHGPPIVFICPVLFVLTVGWWGHGSVGGLAARLLWAAPGFASCLGFGCLLLSRTWLLGRGVPRAVQAPHNAPQHRHGTTPYTSMRAQHVGALLVARHDCADCAGWFLRPYPDRHGECASMGANKGAGRGAGMACSRAQN